MQTLPLIGGSYSSRSVIANAQRCINLYPEGNRKDSPTSVTHYQRPGLAALATSTNASGYIHFGSNPSDGDTITLNSVVWTFRTAPSLPTDLFIAGSLAGTLILAVPLLNSSVNPLMAVATYSFVPATASATDIAIVYDTAGTAGNAYTLAASAATRSAATLLGGLDLISTPAIGRCLYQASNGDGYAVIGVNLYYVSPTYQLIFVGATTGGSGTTICSMIDNGTTLLLVNGAPASAGVGGGWTVNLATRAGFAVVNDAAWMGADRVDYIDTFVVFNELNVAGSNINVFGSTLSNQILPLDATYVAGKTSYPDPIQTLIVCKRQIIILGSLKSEVWYDSGAAAFPFAELSGTNIEHGIGAKYSVATADENVYWLSKDLQGQGFVLSHNGNQTKRISNFALEYAIRLMYQNSGTVADAVGYCYQVDGHNFYVLSFPTGNQTWVYDESVGDPELAWSQRAWVGSTGAIDRDRGVVGANLYGKNCVLDWQNGTLYEQSMTTYTDTVAGVEYPILYLRTFPHLMSGTDVKTGQPILANGMMVQHDRFQLDVTTGTGPSGPSGGQPPRFTIKWSDDRGQSWENPIQLEAGEKGKFRTRNDVRGLGQAMDRVYEVSWTFAGEVALNGAWVEGRVLSQ